MKFIPGGVAFQAGMKAGLHRGDGLLFRRIVLPRVPDDSFQFLAQHSIQRRPPLRSNLLAGMDQILFKAYRYILFQGVSPLLHVNYV
jgi:hypothetical protein